MAPYIAQKYVAAPGSEMIGQLLIGMVGNVQKEETLPIIKKHGLDQIDPQRWYPMQQAMDCLREIYEGPFNVTENLTAIGMTAADVPPGVDSLEGLLEFLPRFYSVLFRNVPAEEGWKVRKLGARHYHMIYNAPAPDQVMYGILWQFANVLKPAGQRFVIRILRAAKPGGKPEPSVFEVKWGPTPEDIE